MTIPHNQLTGSDLHEPKGIAVASEGEVYVADGAGSGSWDNISSRVLLGTLVASSSSSLDYNTITSDYRKYTFELAAITPSTTGADICVRLATTADFLDTLSYRVDNNLAASILTFIQPGHNATIGISSTGSGCYGTMEIIDPSGVGKRKPVFHNLYWDRTAGTDHRLAVGAGILLGTAAITKIRFMMNTGNIASGTIKVYGWVN